MTGGKLGAVIAEVYYFILYMHNHIYVLVAIDFAKCKRNRYLLIANCYQGWPNVIDRFRWITCGQFDNDNLSVQI